MGIKSLGVCGHRSFLSPFRHSRGSGNPQPASKARTNASTLPVRFGCRKNRIEGLLFIENSAYSERMHGKLFLRDSKKLFLLTIHWVPCSL